MVRTRAYGKDKGQGEVVFVKTCQVYGYGYRVELVYGYGYRVELVYSSSADAVHVVSLDYGYRVELVLELEMTIVRVIIRGPP